MNRRPVSSIDHTLRVGMQAVICGAGLLAGLILGATIVYLSGLWQEFGEVLKTPLDSMTTADLIAVAATLVIVFGCGWVGARWGIQRAARIET
jgi:hypothetical protein